jgi:hypothetical protein
LGEKGFGQREWVIELPASFARNGTKSKKSVETTSKLLPAIQGTIPPLVPAIVVSALFVFWRTIRFHCPPAGCLFATQEHHMWQKQDSK